MSEKYVSLNSFKYGLDGRRDVLTSVPGTLQALVNAHINAGGEIEGRASFVKDGVVYPSNTFGLQGTDQGLMVFGSDVAAGGALPTGVVYQRLTPPAGVGIMTSVVFSCNYLGKAFVIATFTGAGLPLCYYNGILVTPSRNGLVLSDPNDSLSPETVSELAVDLASQFNALSGWTAIANFAVIGGVLVATPGAVIVTSPPSTHFTPISTVDTAAGQLSATLVDQNVAGTSAQAASVIFTLNAGIAGTVLVTAPKKADGTGTVQLTGGAVNFHTSLAQTAADIVSLINLLSESTGGYIAAHTGATITIYAPATFGNFTFNLTVVTTGSITTFVGGGGTSLFKLTLTNNATIYGGNVLVQAFADSGETLSATVKAATSGAAGLVTFAWSETNADGTPVSAGKESGIKLSSTTAATIAVSAFLNPGSQIVGNSVSGFFKCVASDAGSGSSATANFTVRFALFAIH